MKVVCSYREAEENIYIAVGDLIKLNSDWFMVTYGDSGYSMVSLTDGLWCDSYNSLSKLQESIEANIQLVSHENFLQSTTVKLEIKKR